MLSPFHPLGISYTIKKAFHGFEGVECDTTRSTRTWIRLQRIWKLLQVTSPRRGHANQTYNYLRTSEVYLTKRTNLHRRGYELSSSTIGFAIFAGKKQHLYQSLRPNQNPDKGPTALPHSRAG